MDTNKMRDISREQFESRCPIPEGCAWNAEQGRYVLFHMKLCPLSKYERFVELWVCWQDSRKDFSVTAPKADDFPMLEHFDYSRKCGFKEGIEFALRSIGCQGVRIKP